MLRFHRKTKTAAPCTGHAPEPKECDALDALPLPYSKLIAEMMAIYCHTRPLGALSQEVRCAEEYRMIARSVMHHILEGWWNQTDGRGTIDDLLQVHRDAYWVGGSSSGYATKSRPTQ